MHWGQKVEGKCLGGQKVERKCIGVERSRESALGQEIEGKCIEVKRVTCINMCGMHHYHFFYKI